MARAATETQKAALSGLEFGSRDPRHRRRRDLGQCRCPRSGCRRHPRVRGCPPRRRQRGDATRRPTCASPIARAVSRTGWRIGRPSSAARSASRRSVPMHPPAARRHPPLAAGTPTARPAVGRERLPQSGRGVGRGADRRRRPQGPPGRGRVRLGEARQLHRLRPVRDRCRRASPWRTRFVPRFGRATTSSSPTRSSSSATGPTGRGRPASRSARRPHDRQDVRTARCRAPRRPIGRARCLDRLGHRDRDRPGRGRQRGYAGPDRPRGFVVVAPCGPRSRRSSRCRVRRARRARRQRPAHGRHGPRQAGRPGPGAGRLHRAPWSVRRGRHGPGSPRGDGPCLHGLRGRRLGHRYGQGYPEAALARPRASGGGLARDLAGSMARRPGRCARRARRVRGWGSGPASDDQASASR